MNIITGTGYYVDAFMSEDVKMMSVKEVYGSESLYVHGAKLQWPY